MVIHRPGAGLNKIGLGFSLVNIMVLKLDGISEHVAHEEKSDL